MKIRADVPWLGQPQSWVGEKIRIRNVVTQEVQIVEPENCFWPPTVLRSEATHTATDNALKRHSPGMQVILHAQVCSAVPMLKIKREGEVPWLAQVCGERGANVLVRNIVTQEVEEVDREACRWPTTFLRNDARQLATPAVIDTRCHLGLNVLINAQDPNRLLKMSSQLGEWVQAWPKNWTKPRDSDPIQDIFGFEVEAPEMPEPHPGWFMVPEPVSLIEDDPYRIPRLEAVGNGVNPRQFLLAYEILMSEEFQDLTLKPDPQEEVLETEESTSVFDLFDED